MAMYLVVGWAIGWAALFAHEPAAATFPEEITAPNSADTVPLQLYMHGTRPPVPTLTPAGLRGIAGINGRFVAQDWDGDGGITVDDLRAFHEGEHDTEDELQTEIKQSDIDENGAIDFGEYFLREMVDFGTEDGELTRDEHHDLQRLVAHFTDANGEVDVYSIVEIVWSDSRFDQEVPASEWAAGHGRGQYDPRKEDE